MFNDKAHMEMLAQSFHIIPEGESGDSMLESAKAKAPGKTGEPKKSLSDAIFEAVSKKSVQDERSVVAAAVISWAKAESPVAEDFDSLALSMANIDDDEEDDDITEGQVDEFNRVLGLLADAAVALGAEQSDVTAMIDDEDDDAALNVADAINGNTEDEDEAIAVYGVSGGDEAMLEANVKVVRNGEVKLIKKRPRPRRITSSQRAALKKARVKAHSASANLSRRKSLKIRRKRGL